MARELRGAHVVVVGATGVLGANIATQLAAAGARVSAIVRDHTRLDGASVSQYALADVTDHEALRTALASVAPFDGVVNATGVVAFGNVVDLDDATLARLFAVNSIAPIVMLRESAAHMNDDGFFVNISGVVATQPVAGMAAYSASKAAAWAAMTSAGRELRRRRIDVIDARPGHTETGLATRPLAGVAPKMPEGLAPNVVAARIVAAITAGERDLPTEAFG
ncbi:MAG: SDR family NAD(P)-dependent oxidoreductase [Ilumatobacteraceae bacterium]|nr:SDR family NAD(P)-dependent oxidoreductase [Ilumatobacteraceae bacterium]